MDVANCIKPLGSALSDKALTAPISHQSCAMTHGTQTTSEAYEGYAPSPDMMLSLIDMHT
jgi:hypothetical protein